MFVYFKSADCRCYCICIVRTQRVSLTAMDVSYFPSYVPCPTKMSLKLYHDFPSLYSSEVCTSNLRVNRSLNLAYIPRGLLGNRVGIEYR